MKIPFTIVGYGGPDFGPKVWVPVLHSVPVPTAEHTTDRNQTVCTVIYGCQRRVPTSGILAQAAYMAERQGFEPWEGVNPRWFSRPVLSTAQPPLRSAGKHTGNHRPIATRKSHKNTLRQTLAGLAVAAPSLYAELLCSQLVLLLGPIGDRLITVCCTEVLSS